MVSSEAEFSSFAKISLILEEKYGDDPYITLRIATFKNFSKGMIFLKMKQCPFTVHTKGCQSSK